MSQKHQFMLVIQRFIAILDVLFNYLHSAELGGLFFSTQV